jgi:hypothetical protein
VQGASKGVISCAVGAGVGVESTRAGRSEESPVDTGPVADCGFTNGLFRWPKLEN